jgi:hypothetical protein
MVIFQPRSFFKVRCLQYSLLTKSCEGVRQRVAYNRARRSLFIDTAYSAMGEMAAVILVFGSSRLEWVTAVSTAFNVAPLNNLVMTNSASRGGGGGS